MLSCRLVAEGVLIGLQRGQGVANLLPSTRLGRRLQRGVVVLDIVAPGKAFRSRVGVKVYFKLDTRGAGTYVSSQGLVT